MKKNTFNGIGVGDEGDDSHAGTLFRATLGGYQRDNELFAYANHIAMGSAHLLASQLGNKLIEIAVWDGHESRMDQPTIRCGEH